MHVNHEHPRTPTIRLARSTLITSLALLTLTACVSSSTHETDSEDLLPEVSIEDFAQVKAQLNFDNGTATTPIADYLTNTDFETEVLFAQAYESLVTTCMSDAGHSYDGLSAVDWDALEPQEDRLFGQWDRTSAAQRGSAMDENRGIPKSTSAAPGPEFTTALVTCNEEVNTGDVLRPLADQLAQPTLADRIQGNSAVRAEESGAGQAADARFAECLEDKSLVVDPDSGYVSAEYAELGTEEDIASAVGEADCNIETGRIQELYDLTARYVAAYMEEYEAQLGAVLEEKQELHRQLQDIIDSAS